MDPHKTPETPQKRTSRFRSAIQALRGEPVVPQAIRAEWVTWQIEFENLLDKVSAAAARAYERDRVKLKAAEKRIKELESAAPDETGPDSFGGKAFGGSWNPAKTELNRIALSRRGLNVPQFIHNGVENNVPGPQAE